MTRCSEKTTRWVRGALLVGMLCARPAAAWAFANGISGYSGQYGPYCASCHSGGSGASVQIDGPAQLAAGQSAGYLLTIAGGPGIVGGLDVSVADPGASLSPGSDTQLLRSEVTHIAPIPFSGGALSFCFTLTAPPTPGTLTLYAAGNSTNGDDLPSGDSPATTTMTVTVLASSASPAPATAAMCPSPPLDPMTAAGCAVAPGGPNRGDPGRGVAMLAAIGLALGGGALARKWVGRKRRRRARDPAVACARGSALSCRRW